VIHEHSRFNVIMKKVIWVLLCALATVRLFAQAGSPVKLALIAESKEAATAVDVLDDTHF
jgi:hypothetical protein